MCQVKKKKLTKALGRKHVKLNKRKEESNITQQKVVQLIHKLAPISKHTQLETKKMSTEFMLWLKQPQRLLDAMMCKEEIIIKRSKAQPIKSRWLSKEKKNFKESLAEEIVPSDGTQPPSCFQMDGDASMQSAHHLYTCTITS